MTDLNDDQLARYARHIVLPEIGGMGQQRIAKARVLIVGAGGLGCPLAAYLAAAGVGRLDIVDDDRIDLSNLQRQILYVTADVGQHKATAAARRLHALNPEIAIKGHVQRLDGDRARAIFADYDVIADGSDNFATRLTIADAARTAHVPLVSAAIGAFTAQIATFYGWQADQPCYRCLVGAPEDAPGQTCAHQGILGAVAGVAGSLQALEVLRVIVGFGVSNAGRLILWDGLTQNQRHVRIAKDPACPACRA